MWALCSKFRYTLVNEPLPNRKPEEAAQGPSAQGATLRDMAEEVKLETAEAAAERATKKERLSRSVATAQRIPELGPARPGMEDVTLQDLAEQTRLQAKAAAAERAAKMERRMRSAAAAEPTPELGPHRPGMQAVTLQHLAEQAKLGQEAAKLEAKAAAADRAAKRERRVQVAAAAGPAAAELGPHMPGTQGVAMQDMAEQARRGKRAAAVQRARRELQRFNLRGRLSTLELGPGGRPGAETVSLRELAEQQRGCQA